MSDFKPEILAPAGSPDSLLAAVRCGANAVYLGGKSFNARRNATNFDGDSLKQAVRYCHERGVKVYLALNTLVFDSELEATADMVRTACVLGIDALIVQDTAVAAISLSVAPCLPLHASTQMSIHNPAGAKELEALGFSRVVLARELSRHEILEIHESTSLELECFVHGALCMSISGRCYFSSMLGGRSGNRGLCAQPCRLPFKSQNYDHCLSLKDLSLVENIWDMISSGVVSLKIEGRMKRPEYVAAAVTAVKKQIAGETPDLDGLRSVFSRDGFTNGYFAAKTGGRMFGMRSREDVTAANPALLSKLASLYKNETGIIPVDFELTLKANKEAVLIASDGLGNSAAAKSAPPQTAITAPTTREKAFAALAKTGGTPFFARDFTADIDDGLMLPASALNTLRREVLDNLLKLRGETKPHKFAENPNIFNFVKHQSKTSGIRVRVQNAEQISREIAEKSQLLIIPAQEFDKTDSTIINEFADKIAIEAPRALFGIENENKLKEILRQARKNISHGVAGGLDTINILREEGFKIHGDFTLNITNTLTIEEYAKLGLVDATVSFELSKGQVSRLGVGLPRGIVAYGRLPLMITRNCPVGSCKCCKAPVIIDRLGNKFPVRCGFGVSEVLNCVPLVLSDKLGDFAACDFFTLSFTTENPMECAEIFNLYLSGMEYSATKTRGLYYRGVR